MSAQQVISGKARWVPDGGELHKRLLADGWEATEMRRAVFGSGVYVMLVKVDTK